MVDVGNGRQVADKPPPAPQQPLVLNPQPHFPVQAPHFVFDVIAPELIERFGADALARGGLRVTTSLDLDLQNKGQAALDHWIGEFEDSAKGHNGAMVSIDPKTSEIYSVESDTGDKMVVFPNNADGNIAPKRMLHSPHRVYNIAADETKGELYVTVEFPPEVIVYRKEAFGEEQPQRRIRGDRTGLDAPHGIAVDEKNRLLFVNTWGHASNFRVKGTGAFYPPAIKVYSLDADGDAAPLRVITGDKTQLNWPAAMKFNPDNGDLYVANDIGQSILVFSGASTAQGNVAPARAVKGSRTKLAYPTGVALDRKNQELWVSNLGSSSATVYPLMATGDVAPLRVIRSAPLNKKSLNFGRTAAVAYDNKREQILVPN